jgi:hypothetical protein
MTQLPVYISTFVISFLSYDHLNSKLYTVPIMDIFQKKKKSNNITFDNKKNDFLKMNLVNLTFTIKSRSIYQEGVSK